MKRSQVLIPLLVLVAALGIRLQPIVGESFHYDAIVSQEAAGDGVVANALDHENTWRLRRYHPPLISYVIIVNNAVFGNGLTGARVFAMVFGAAACVLVTIAVLVFGHGGGRREHGPVPGTRAGAAVAGLLLAFLPVHLYISRTAGWDAVYSALCIGTLLALAWHLASPCRRRVWAVGVLAALSFLTCELGLALLPAIAAAWFVDRRREGYSIRPWLVAGLLGVAVVAVLWPAGVFRLDILRTLRFRWYDSTYGDRNASWTGFYSTLWEQAPTYTVAAAVTLVGLAGAWRRRSRHHRWPPLSPMIPMAVYAATIFALSTRQRLVYIHHIADLFPALTVLIGEALVLAWAAARTATARSLLAVVAVVGVTMAAADGFGDDPDVVGPQEHPGLATIGQFLLDHPHARTFFHYTAQMEYYAPGAEVVGSPHRHWTADDIAEAKVGNFDYVVSDISMLEGDLITGPGELADALKPTYALEKVIDHRRSGEPVAWIFARRR
jgi:hypothetical protein